MTFAEYLAANRTARLANRDTRGRVKNNALERRLYAALRVECIRRLGWAPETGNDPGQHYAASTGEMVAWLTSEAA